MGLRMKCMAVCLFFINCIPSLASDLTVINYTQNSVQINWHLADIKLVDHQIRENVYKSIEIEDGDYIFNAGKPKIPYRYFILAVPEGATVTYSLEITNSEVITDILPMPIMTPRGNKNDIIYYDYMIDEHDYNFLPAQTIELSEQQYFRSMPVIMVSFFPVIYNYSDKSLKIIRSAKIKFTFNGGSQKGSAPLSPSRIDYLYEKKILNFNQARNWFIKKPLGLKKTLDVPDGPWYRMTITEDGLYRITRETLESAGINVANLNPDRIKIYNHGGMTLSVNTMSDLYNPSGPVENARYIAKRTDGSFDYLIFYGKQLGGWIYSASANNFNYQNHPYDTQNYYWLVIGDQPGKEMNEVISAASSASINETYFMDRKHYEEDIYNLLNSGTDWYGYRFFGLDATKSFGNLMLDYWEGNEEQAILNIKVKSGNNILISTSNEADCTYYFTINLNQKLLLSNRYLGSTKSEIFTRSFRASDFLVNGSNTINIQYKGNREDCVAHLDWIEFYYPKKLSAKNDFLEFYTNHPGENVHYSIDGFTKSDLKLFDVSDPVDVKLINTNGVFQQGKYSFNLDLSDNINRKIIISSLSSAHIKEISALNEYTPGKNLLATNNKADFIVIAPSVFFEYAQELIQLRTQTNPSLTSMVVDIQDIYFYFSSGVQDPVAIRNFLRYAYYNWQNPRPSYVLFFGNGHYDYRYITINNPADHPNYIPPFEISNDSEIHSRETDAFYSDIDYNNTDFNNFVPDLAFGRLPVKSTEHARAIIDKLKSYVFNKSKDAWQTVLTFVADDENNPDIPNIIEWDHQEDTDSVTRLEAIQKFLIKKIYLSAYDKVPGGLLWKKPEANKAIIDQLNEGTLIISYFGHGNANNWAHESALNSNRDLPLIQNEGKLPIFIAGTCAFGKYDTPTESSMSEALIWQEKTGAIGVISAARAVYPDANVALVAAIFNSLFPDGQPSKCIGDAYLEGLLGGAAINEQKFHLFADPTMYLADPRNNIRIVSIEPDSLKALSKVKVQGEVINSDNEGKWLEFNGGAMMIVNDACYDSVNTGGWLYYSKMGPRLFKGEVSVKDGLFNAEFIVPKSIRYSNKPKGRITVYAWNESGSGDAFGIADSLIFNGSRNIFDNSGPEIKIYFEGQKNFNDGDFVSKNPVIIAEINDENGINLTQESGHAIDIKVDDQLTRDITLFFMYDRDSCTSGKLTYHLNDLKAGSHHISLKVWDNLNNSSEKEISFEIAEEKGLVLENVVNYPNPFSSETSFTFQIQGINNGSEIMVKIYTIAGRLIKTIGPEPVGIGFNYIHWNGKDEDDDAIANGVYLYKVILKSNQKQKEKIEKMVKIR